MNDTVGAVFQDPEQILNQTSNGKRSFFRTHRSLWGMLTGAVLTGFTVIFPQIGLLQWISMIPIFWCFYCVSQDPNTSYRRAYMYGFFTVLAYYLVIYHWFLAMYPLDFAGLTEQESAIVVVLGWVGLSLLQAIPGGVMFLLYHRLNRLGAFESVPALRPMILPICWVVLEWLSTLGWTGVPMGRLCLGQIRCLPILQSASLFGSYFVSFLLLSVNALLAYALFRKPVRVLCASLAAGILVSSALFGVLRIKSLQNRTAEPAVTVAVLQGNVSIYDSRNGNSYQEIKAVYADLTRQAAAEGAEIVIWPETTLPYDLSENFDLRYFVSNLAKNCRVSILLGALDSDAEGNEYNALYFVQADGTFCSETYRKRKLVPFGEYVPMRELFETLVPPLAELMAAGSDLTAGEEATVFETEYGAIGTLICYDSIYENLARETSAAGADWIAIASNDAWFRNSAAVDLHEAQAQLRAIENGKWIVSAVNTGVSSVISSDGKVLEHIGKDTAGYAVASISTASEKTLFTKIGNGFIGICIAVLAAVCGFGIFLRIRTGKKCREEHCRQGGTDRNGSENSHD